MEFGFILSFFRGAGGWFQKSTARLHVHDQSGDYIFYEGITFFCDRHLKKVVSIYNHMSPQTVSLYIYIYMHFESIYDNPLTAEHLFVRFPCFCVCIVNF